MSRIALHGYISGRVQGVSFRAFVATQAQHHDVNGWTRNVPDGRVEVFLCGDETAVQQVATALHRGPPYAHVTNVALSKVPVGDHIDFTIR
ncbi:MAG: acyP [Verrucomicrobiaceae bacterium]|nr:acyP [Verrucomicrobiaceae bacterium]